MKRSLAVLFLLLSGIMLQPTDAHASFIVNTGAGDPNASGGPSLGGSTNQWLAGRFSTDQQYTITSIEGWISESSIGSISLALYGGDDPVNPFSIPRPNVGNEIFRQTFNTFFEIGLPRVAWQGVSGINLILPAGDYWIAMEVIEGSMFMPNDVPNPLDNYAFINDLVTTPGWNPRTSSLGLGFRVEAASAGPSNSIPEPMSMALFAFGLAGLGFVRRCMASA